MKPQLEAKLAELRKKRNFDPAKWVEQKCSMLNDYMKKSGLKGVVVNVSGGIDSAVTILLCKHAQEMEGSPITRVLGLCQPIHSTASIQDRGKVLCDKHNIECAVIDQTEVFDMLHPIIEKAINVTDPPAFATGQLRSYMRTPPAYYACQILSSSGTPSIVIGTGNFDEDGYLYYFCKPGDGTSDVQLIHDLHKSEVKEVAKYLKCTEEIIVAPPSADLWEGQTDENELGFPYSFCELFIELSLDEKDRDEWIKTLDEENRKQWDEWEKMIVSVHRRNGHKAKWPINLDIICPLGNE